MAHCTTVRRFSTHLARRGCGRTSSGANSSLLWMRCARLGFLMGLLLLASTATAARLDRGLVALEREGATIYIGWRMLASDSQETAFDLIRIGPGTTRIAIPLGNAGRTTNGIDAQAAVGETYAYELSKKLDPASSVLTGPFGSVQIKVTGKPQTYVRIPLDGDYDFQKIGIADLDGDGQLEYIIKQPNFNTDPYQRPGYWKKSPSTYKLEAYKQDGTLMWRYDMGWAIEAGIWYAPWIVYDVDQDGKAEVYCKAGEGDPRDAKGLVKSGLEYLVKLDGETGRVVAKTAWLSRAGYQDYNRYCRNFLAVAYLDGKRPAIIMQRGTYRLIRTRALDRDLNPIWTWEASASNSDYRGQGSHGLVTADVDGDGRDELVIGAACIDDDGRGLWTLAMGHPDVCYVADIDPENPGLEVYYGFETRQKTDGICLVDAKSGRKLWTHKKPTRHIHAQGMVGDILAESPGMEVYSGERDYAERWLYSSTGKLLQFLKKGTLSPRPLWWDADLQKEVILQGGVQDWGGRVLQRLEGRVIATVDCLADDREEVITSIPGEIRIYSTTMLSTRHRRCLLLDHQYRMGVVAQTMGYYYPAKLGLQ
jgi:rhamnogalacturonan endolyase